MRRAYRIERASDGAGPFGAGLWSDLTWSKNPRAMPSPRYGHKRGPHGVGLDWKPLTGEWRYAFDGLTSLARWCSFEALREAQDKGFVVRVVAVPWNEHAWLTDQIVYRWRAATVLREMSPLAVPVELECRGLRQMAA